MGNFYLQLPLALINFVESLQFNRPIMITLKPYISTINKHSLFFLKERTNDIKFVDIGTLLVHAIESSLDNQNLPFLAEEELEKIINKNVCHSSDIGSYIAIRNIGILFEPTLRIDTQVKFSAWSRNYTLIVDIAEGTIQNDIFYLAGDTESTYKINLSDIPYQIH